MWNPFGSVWLRLERRERDRALQIIAAVREPAGPQVELMIEGHGRFDVPTAIGLTQEMVPFRPIWFEEPIPPESISALAEVRAKSPVAIATGERYYEPQRFRELIDARAADYLQLDVSHVGGLGEAKRIAALAHLSYLPICPHNPLGPVANAMTLHLAAATPNCAWLETMVTDVPWRSEIVREALVIADGAMLVPDAPGLGIELDEDACADHPPGTYGLRHYGGALTDIRPMNARPFYAMRALALREDGSTEP